MTAEWVDRTLAGVLLAVLVTGAVLAALLISQLSVAPAVTDGTGAAVEHPADGSAAGAAIEVRG